MLATLTTMFGLDGRVAVVTGGTGVLGGAAARGLARVGARVAVLGRSLERAEHVAREIVAQGGDALAVTADVQRRDDLERARDAIIARWGAVDILVNFAGGNHRGATLADTAEIFDLPVEEWRAVVDVNLIGTILPVQVFGAVMARQEYGAIVNISSVAARRSLSRVPGYAMAKAGIENFTHWLAALLPQRYGNGIRVNAIVPGFFLGAQNRHMLLNDGGTPTDRGQAILEHTPAGRFGDPDDLVGTIVWLCSPSASFVNGAVVPVDGGFTAYGGF